MCEKHTEMLESVTTMCFHACMDEPLLTPEEVQNLLKISQRQLRYLRERRLIPYVRVGGQARFYNADVEAFVKSRTVGAA